jgi:hypothetical protein
MPRAGVLRGVPPRPLEQEKRYLCLDIVRYVAKADAPTTCVT